MMNVYKNVTVVLFILSINLSASAADSSFMKVRNELWNEGVAIESTPTLSMDDIIANLQHSEEVAVIPEELQVVLDRYFRN